MNRLLTSVLLAFAFALVPVSLVLSDVSDGASLARSFVPLVILGALPAVAGLAVAPWVVSARSRTESAGRGLLAGLVPMLVIAAGCLVAVKLDGPLAAAWMLVVAMGLTLVNSAIGAVAGALLHCRPAA